MSTPDPIQAAAMDFKKKIDHAICDALEEGQPLSDSEELDIIATAMRALVAREQLKDILAVADLREELADAKEILREIRDNEVLPRDEADKFLRDHQPSVLSLSKIENARLRERVAELEGADIDRNRLTLELENMSSGYMRAQDRLAAANERVAELERDNESLRYNLNCETSTVAAVWRALEKKTYEDCKPYSISEWVEQTVRQLAAANERVAELEKSLNTVCLDPNYEEGAAYLRNRLNEKIEANADLRAQLAAARRDAERYQWLKRRGLCWRGCNEADTNWIVGPGTEWIYDRNGADATIDAAMQREDVK